jgi:hypothetical protein
MDSSGGNSNYEACDMTPRDRAVVTRMGRGLVTVGLFLLAVGTGVAAEGDLLSEEDVLLLLLSGATAEKKVRLIQEHGVDFSLTGHLEQKLRAYGRDTGIIQAIQRAKSETNTALPSSPKEPLSKTNSEHPSAGIKRTLDGIDARGGSSNSSTAHDPPKCSSLPDPEPRLVARIIEKFSRNDKAFIEARKNYTYHQVYKINELDDRGRVVGTFHKEWDVVIDDRGEVVVRITYSSPSTLKRIYFPGENQVPLRAIAPILFPPEVLAAYEIAYVGHVRLAEISAYVFSVRPRFLDDGNVYFQGAIWVEDQDLQVVRLEGKNVPDRSIAKRDRLLYPHFVDYREQLDGKNWFPSLVLADDILRFPDGPVHAKFLVKYSNYRRFKSEVRIIPSAETGVQDGEPGLFKSPSGD